MKSKFFYVSLLHFFNDGFSASLLLFLPFIAKDMGLNLTKVGILGSGMNLLPIALALPSALLADRFGHFKTLLFALLICGIAYLLMSLATGFGILLLLFILIGIPFGLFHPIGFALVSRLSGSENIGRHIGNFTAWGDVGRLAISGGVTFIIVAWGWRSSALLYGVAGVAVFMYLYFFHFRTDRLNDQKREDFQLGKFTHLLQNRQFIYAAAVTALDNLASSGLFLFLPFLLLSKHIQPTFLSSFAGAFIVGTLLGKAVLGRWVDRLGSVKVFVITEILMAVLIVLLTVVSALWLIVIISVVLGIATRGTVPATQTMVYQSMAESQNFERANGVAQFGDTVAAVIVPILLGLTSDRLGINWAFWLAAGFALLAVIPAVAFGNVRLSSDA
ncbi:MAG: MFS transporter [Candidatus Doudnabacteria bacterium]|nr:MFS transporter [Candidatus Doudnabacteria bacterium]